LLRPDDDINNAIAYCLAVTAARCNITVLLATVESNHHHTVIYDRDGTCPQFLENFHKLVARCINARYGRTENVWASVEPCVTVLLDHETVLAKLAYTAANPVQDRLVERAVQWPGLNGYRHLLANRPLRATRPRFFFKRDGAMPAEATLEFTIPPELGKREDVIIELRERVEAIERATKASRAGPCPGRSQCLGRGLAAVHSPGRETGRGSQPHAVNSPSLRGSTRGANRGADPVPRFSRELPRGSRALARWASVRVSNRYLLDGQVHADEEHANGQLTTSDAGRLEPPDRITTSTSALRIFSDADAELAQRRARLFAAPDGVVRERRWAGPR